MDDRGYTTDRYGNPRIADCLRDGWRLFKANIATIAVLSASIFLLTHLRLWLVYMFEVSLGGGVSVNPASFAELLAVISGALEKIPLPPPQFAMLTAFDLLTQLIVDFVTFCGMALIVTKSLLIIDGADSSFAAVRGRLKEKTGRLVKYGIILQLIILLPNYASQLLYVSEETALGSWLTGLPEFLFSALMLLFLASALLALAASFIEQYCVLFIIDGNKEKTVSSAMRLTRRTFGKLFIMGMLTGGVYFIITMPLSGMDEAGYPTWGIAYLLSAMTAFYQFAAVTALFHRTVRIAQAEEPPPAVEPVWDIQEEPDEPDDTAPLRFRVPPSLRYGEVGQYRNGFARIRQTGTGKWGYADIKGRPAFPYAFSEAGDFNGGMAVARKGQQECFIETSGKMLFGGGYESADPFREGLALVRTKSGWAYLTLEGELRPVPYDDAFAFSEGFAAAYDGEQWVYIDHSLEPVLTTGYEEIWSFSGGLAMVFKDGRFGYIDRKGREAVPLRYDDARSFSEGFAAVAVKTEEGLRWGYIGQKGEERIPWQFEEADSFSEGRAAVCRDGRYGFIDGTGTFAVPPQYQAAGAFKEGFAVVKDVLFGYVDSGGQECTALDYLEARPFSEGLAWVRTADGWGILELNSNNK